VADIDIVPKGRSATWLWILLAIIVAIVLMWMLMGRGPARSGQGSGAAHPALATVGTSGTGVTRS
jgi:hypothetical protein